MEPAFFLLSPSSLSPSFLRPPGPPRTQSPRFPARTTWRRWRGPRPRAALVAPEARRWCEARCSTWGRATPTCPTSARAHTAWCGECRPSPPGRGERPARGLRGREGERKAGRLRGGPPRCVPPFPAWGAAASPTRLCLFASAVPWCGAHLAPAAWARRCVRGAPLGPARREGGDPRACRVTSASGDPKELRARPAKRWRAIARCRRCCSSAGPSRGAAVARLVRGGRAALLGPRC